MEHTYRIRGRVAYLVFSLIWGAVVVGISIDAWPHRWNAETVFRAFLLVGFALLPAIITARIPRHVTVSDEGTCTFGSFLGGRTIRAQRIKSISSIEDDETRDITITIRHDAGRIRIFEMDDFEGFLAQLLELNPAIKVGELPYGFDRSPSPR